MAQIEVRDIPRYRSMFASRIRYICPICEEPMRGKSVTLDHCHLSGRLRGAICNACNRAEGKVRMAITHHTMRRMVPKEHMMWTNPSKWLENLSKYLVHHQDNPSDVIHPTFDLVKGKQKPKRKAT
jgi:hypothetical protein